MTADENAPGDGTGGADDEQRGGGVVTPIVRRDRRDWRAVWQPMQAQARAEMEARRARVLAHPDLAQALTERPVGYARPEQWTGYVPPRTDPPHERGAASPLNTSARRRALVEMAAEALKREQQEEAG